MDSVIEIIIALCVALFASFGIVMLFYHALFDAKVRKGILLQKNDGVHELQKKLCDAMEITGSKCADDFLVFVPESEKENDELASAIRRLGLNCVYYYQELNGR